LVANGDSAVLVADITDDKYFTVLGVDGKIAVKIGGHPTIGVFDDNRRSGQRQPGATDGCCAIRPPQKKKISAIDT
jgi:hypothetical protein